MIKKISIDQLQPGMYVHDLNCSWVDHPFVRSRFKVSGKELIAKMRKLGTRDLYIDTDKGLDVAAARTEREVNEALNAELKDSVQNASPEERDTPLKEEQARAERIEREATRLVTDLLGDVRLGRQLEIERVNPVVEKMVGSIFRNQDALLGLSRIRQMDRYTFEHSVGVAVLMLSFARALELDRDTIQEIGVGALLHDMGKTLVPNEILNKPGRLTESEFSVMRRHVEFSCDLLAAAPGISPVALSVAAEHHERHDGSGYPEGKKGDGISRHGQMAAIVDVYDAMSSDRVYHKGMEPHRVLRKLLEWSTHHFNPTLVQHFIRCVGIYPIGTLVRLESGRLGVVVESGSEGPMKPVVRLVMDSKTRRYLTPRDLDLSSASQGKGDRIVGTEMPADWRVDAETVLQLNV